MLTVCHGQKLVDFPVKEGSSIIRCPIAARMTPQQDVDVGTLMQMGFADSIGQLPAW